ncbi:MAG: TolC family protein [Desulfobacteraceae bacterium]|nr:TolC family protein [Desulfobacteraceae bacterium]
MSAGRLFQAAGNRTRSVPAAFPRRAWERGKENNVKIAQSGYYPRIYLKSEYYLTGNKDDLYKSWSGLSRDNWSVNLNFQFNIFEGFLTKSKIRQAVADKASSQKELAGAKQNIEHEIRQAFNLVYGKEKELKTAARVVHIEQQNLTAVEKEFELGVSSVDRVVQHFLNSSPLSDTFRNRVFRKNPVSLSPEIRREQRGTNLKSAVVADYHIRLIEARKTYFKPLLTWKLQSPI